MDSVYLLQRKYDALKDGLDEQMRRRWAATEAQALGHGGMTLVARVTGLTLPTIRRGLREVAAGVPMTAGRVRQPGGGRKPLVVTDPAIGAALEALVDPVTRGDPMSPLRWTCKSTARLAAELTAQGHAVSPNTVATRLHDLDYSLQSTRKTREGGTHPDRNAQFEHINAQVAGFQRRGQPVISVDAKKKELVGDFKNAGREWQPKGRPEAVRVYDFIDPARGKAIPYGVYDLTENAGWVTVGTDHDTPAFAAAAIGQWWRQMGAADYPAARDLLITADGGGSNSARSRLWKVEVQRFADATGLRVHVCHFPPGTSKWNKIEHRLFCHITANWRGRPLVSHEVVVQLIGATTTAAGLTVRAALDTNTYPTGIKVSDAELDRVRLKPEAIHGNWNYRILPHDSARKVKS